MAMEGDHVEILALAQALDISMHIVSMDGEQEHLAHHVIPEGAEPSLHLLHHSSHYNILYLLPSQNWPTGHRKSDHNGALYFHKILQCVELIYKIQNRNC